MTYQEIIKKLLEARFKNDSEIWTPSHDLICKQTECGWLGSSGSRRARELAERGEIERQLINGYAHYRWIPPKEMAKVEFILRSLQGTML